MHVNELSPRSQDYRTALWDYSERTGEPAPLGELATRTGQKTSIASEARKRLDAEGLVLQECSAGIRHALSDRFLDHPDHIPLAESSLGEIRVIV